MTDPFCPVCGATFENTTCVAEREDVKYGESRSVSVILPYHTCSVCQSKWMDYQAEAIRTFAVDERLAAERTPEEKAIELFLSNPAPTSNACGCMGRQPRAPSRHSPGLSYPRDTYQEIVVHHLGRDKMKTVQLLRREFDLPLHQAKPIFDSGTFRKQCTWINEGSVRKLNALGCKVEVIEHEPDLEPVCPCAMKWVVEVDSHYYMISENRMPSGITHTAESIGPVGGPYRVNPSSR